MICLIVYVVASLVLLSAGKAEKRHLYVKPTSTSSGCPQDEVCMTFSDYLQSVSDYFTSNTAIHFLPGNHTISEPSHKKNDRLLVSSVNNLSLSGYGGDTTLHCTEMFGFAFVNITNLHISDIRIFNCGQAAIATVLKITKSLSLKMPPKTKVALTLVNLKSLLLHNVQIKASYGYGLLGVNLFSNSTITNCIFTHNMWRSDDVNTSSIHKHSQPGGNSLFLFTDRESLQFKYKTEVLHISQCEFAHGIDANTFHVLKWIDLESSLHAGWLNSDSSPFPLGSGLGIFLKFSGHYLNAKHMKINITNSAFYHNNAPHGPGANIFVIFGLFESTVSTTVDISNCTLHGGKAVQGGGVFIGLTTRDIEQSQSVVVRLTNSTITNNSARSGGGLSIKSNSIKTKILIQNCVFSGNKAIHGAAVHIAGYASLYQMNTAGPLFMRPSRLSIFGPTMNINVTQTTFMQNTAEVSGGALHINCFMFTFNPDQLRLIVGLVEVNCSNCHFIENKAEIGYALNINNCNLKQDPHAYNGRDTFIDNNFGPPEVYATSTNQTYRFFINFFKTTIVNNGAHTYKNGHCAAVFCIHNTEEILLSDSVFVGNNGSAVYVNGSNLCISGLVNITGNHGVSGGGLYFDCNPRSFLYLTPHSQLYMANNTASLHGGAIAVKDCSTQINKTKCFIQIFDENEECSPLLNDPITINEPIACNDKKIIMENNTADAGDSVYGGLLDRCYMLLGEKGDKWIPFSILQTRILQIRNKLSSSEVASDPFQVCFCHGYVGLKYINELHTEVYRGQTLRIPAVAVGQFNNASPASVQTRITSNQSEIFNLLGETQKFQELGRDCGSLVYLFDLSRTQDSNFELQISIERSRSVIKSSPAVVHVAILDCPPGFELSSDLFSCQCQPHLKIYGIKCDIDTQTFTRSASMWIGYYRKEQVTVHTNCPFHYCIPEGHDEFTLDNQDDQCAFNHSGVLCGACQQGLSLALGTSQCLKCSNVYLLLLIPFALAGVALVFLLLKCNLTVSVGSINGLIFYANIIQVNHPTFFPQGFQNMNLLTKFLSVFIAWLNLDFGIQTCFFTGMTAYTKTWFQFVFPAYVWIMVSFMIYGSRRYPTVSRLIGSNSIQVLATLFLLSYAKLLRTVIAAALSTTLTGESSSTPLVWLLDGNVSFFRGSHSALLLMALAVLLIYIIPLTILVLLGPYLPCNLNYRALRLVNIKLKPLLDAYQGPYKDRFRHWTGLMLLMRVAVLAVFAGNILGKPEMNLFAVIASIQLLGRNVGRAYKNVLWNITESFYLLNLVILSAATLLLRSLDEPSTSSSQEILTDVMVGTAFAAFCAIVLYHFCVYVLKTSVTPIKVKQAMQALITKKYRNQNRPACTTSAVNQNPNVLAPNNGYTVSYFELNQLHEPLSSDNLNN